MSLIPWWMKLIAVAALAAAVAWAIHLYDKSISDAQRAKDVAEYNVKLVAAEEQARAKESDWKAQLKGAQDEADKLRKDKDAMAAANNATVGKLRDQLTNISNGLSSITLTACRARVSTLTIIFGQCTDQLADMADHAQGHYVDSITCRKAWPNQESRP